MPTEVDWRSENRAKCAPIGSLARYLYFPLGMLLFITLLLATFTVGDVSFEMVPVRGGTFQMGGTIEQRSEPGALDQPVHPVALSSYYIGQTEVTRRLWKAVMGEDRGDWLVDDLPVEWVSWNDCQVFLHRLDSLTGMPFRLPTEAEWEFAARGGRDAGQQYRFSGSRNYDEVAWLYLNSENRTHAVATKKPNQLGIYDMTGNVWEWCSDWFGPYTDEIAIDPLGPDEERIVNDERQGRVVRGSSWDNAALNTRISVREGRDPSYSFYDCGLRLALSGESDASIAAEQMQFVSDEKQRKRKARATKISWPKDSTWAKTKIAGQTFTFVSLPGHRLMMETELTQKQYQAILKAAKRKDDIRQPSFSGGAYPQNNLSWYDAQLICFYLDSISGHHFRLPSSQEWEYAAHGGEKSVHLIEYNELTKPKKTGNARKRRNVKNANVALGLLGTITGGLVKEKEIPEDEILMQYKSNSRDYYTYAGSDVATEVGWIAANSNGTLHPVGKLAPNELGLMDMTGNVGEWTSTRSEDGGYILRGGYYQSNTDAAKVDQSLTLKPHTASEQTGVRLILEW